MVRQLICGTLLALAATQPVVAQAALQGRDLNGSADSFEAYYDTVLDITWLADANYAKTSGYDADGRMTWSQAASWAADLSFYNPATQQTLNNWRLPVFGPVNGVSFDYTHTTDGSTDAGFNITSPNSELAYMFHVNLSNSSYYTPTGELSGCDSGSGSYCLSNVGPFTNLQPDKYWYGVEYEPTPDTGAWYFGMMGGFQYPDGKTYPAYAWAVRDGDVAAVPEADTWAMLLAGLAIVGMAARRRM